MFYIRFTATACHAAAYYFGPAKYLNLNRSGVTRQSLTHLLGSTGRPPLTLWGTCQTPAHNRRQTLMNGSRDTCSANKAGASASFRCS
jgi:hypothetical protein